MPFRLNLIAAGFIATFAIPAAVSAQGSPQAAPQASQAQPQVASQATPAGAGASAPRAPTDPQFEAAKNFISFYTFNRLAFKQVCDKQAVDVSGFVNTFVSENAAAYSKAMSILQAHGITEAAVMARLQGTIASSEPDVRQALEQSAARENVGSTTLDGCKFLASHADKLAGDLDMKKAHPEVIQALNGGKP